MSPALALVGLALAGIFGAALMASGRRWMIAGIFLISVAVVAALAILRHVGAI